MTTASAARFDINDYRLAAELFPVEYTRAALGINLWSKQQAILEACADPDTPYVSVRSANGVGKTYLTASIICQYLDTHYPGYAVVSSSSWKQLEKTVWPTLRRIVSKAPAPLGGDFISNEWRRGDMWGAFCVSPNLPENFSGFRTERGVLVIVDEASALDDEVHSAIMGLASARGSTVVYLGNPLYPEGPFFDTFENPDWVNFHIDAHEVIDLDIPGLATQEWIDMCRRAWGEKSPMYRARVLGQFPSTTTHTLIQMAWLAHIIVPKVTKPKGRKKIGVDVARYGDDRTVVLVRDDRCVVDVKVTEKQSLMETVGLIRSVADSHRVDENDIFIDDTGVGGGVTDRLHELGIDVVPVNFGEAARDRETFLNCRTELYWTAKSRLEEESQNKFYIPKEWAPLAKELTWPRYKLRSDGRIQLESKDDIKKRKKASPDLADALAVSFAGPDDAIDSFSVEAA